MLRKDFSMLNGMKIATAEEIGIKSACVEKFLDVLENNNIRMHSFLLWALYVAVNVK